MLILILSYLTDLIFGQPEKFKFHPVRMIGKLIEIIDLRINKNDNALTGKIKGALTAIFVIAITMSVAYLLIKISTEINPYLGLIVSVYIAYASFTVKELIKAAYNVFNEIDKNLDNARKNLQKIVTRKTENLSKEQIIKSTIESTSENLNDSVVAPLFYLIIGGPVLAIGYRAVNTLDAMIGYKNKRYINFGYFSAKLDDILNFIPARITGFLICISASILDHNLNTFKNALKIMLRDGRKHESPNAGLCEAAMAGALGIKLGSCYEYPENKKKCKQEMGEDKAKIDKFLIKKCVNICLFVSFIVVIIGIIIKILLFYG